MSERNFDLIVFGATAFTGKRAVRYLAEHAPAGLKWAVSARSKEKLLAVVNDLPAGSAKPAELLIADQLDAAKMDEFTKKTKVALAFAGPFRLHGSELFGACARNGTHYLDITGETLWVREMMDKWEEQAKKSGAVLIPFSGFDSVPSDMGTWKLLGESKQRPTEMITAMSMKAGINGGTFVTVLDLMENADLGKVRDPLLLAPGAQRPSVLRTDPFAPKYLSSISRWGAPFIMGPVNSRVVHRSQVLRGEPLFAYSEYQTMPGAVAASLVSALPLGVALVGLTAPGRKLLRAVGPKPGQGPDSKMIEGGHFKARFAGLMDGKVISRGELSFDGDPGNKATVAMACESALAVLDRAQSGTLPAGGTWTPSTGLGEALWKRLMGAGFKWSSGA